MTLRIGTVSTTEPGRAKVLVNHHQRKKELGYFPAVNKVMKRQIRERDNFTCQICGQPGKEVDHIIPLKISHDNSASNLRCLCHKCNIALRLKRRDARRQEVANE